MAHGYQNEFFWSGDIKTRTFEKPTTHLNMILISYVVLDVLATRKIPKCALKPSNEWTTK